MMNGDLYNKLRETYPPTPQVFKAGIEQAMRALPERRAHWSLPAPAVAAYAIAAFAALALLVSGVVLPAGFPGKTAQASAQPSSPSPKQPSAPALQPSPSPAASPTASPAVNYTGAPTPPPVSPLPRLAVVNSDKTPTAEDGWQAAAVSGDATWYFNPSASEIARAEGGKTVMIALALALGQAVDIYTFLPARDGRWLAFTVHTANGDTVWLITKDGRKMVIPDDIRWCNSSSHQTIQVDFSKCTLVPVYMKPMDTAVDAEYSENEGVDYITICATYPDRSIYRIQVYLNLKSGYPDLDLNDRQGDMIFMPFALTDGQTVIADQWSIDIAGMGRNGKYQIDSHTSQLETELQSNRFLMFKANDGRHVWTNPTSALLIYQNDPTLTLWELNMSTGKTKQLVNDCLAAGWIDAMTYWYTSKTNPTTIQVHAENYLKTIIQQIVLTPCVYMSSNGSDTNNQVTLRPTVTIQNDTNEDITIPACISSSLKMKKDGVKIWEQIGDFQLVNAKKLSLSSVNSPAPTGTEPITIPAGDMLEMELTEVPYQGPGKYTLEGSFYKNRNINITVSLPYGTTPVYGMKYDGFLTNDKRLSVTMTNNSHSTFTILQPYEGVLPPTIVYRLLRGEKVIGTGKLTMSSKPLSVAEEGIALGASKTLVESGDAPAFAKLPAGEYRLECMLEFSSADATMPWGFGEGEYFDVTFTVPAK